MLPSTLTDYLQLQSDRLLNRWKDIRPNWHDSWLSHADQAPLRLSDWLHPRVRPRPADGVERRVLMLVDMLGMTSGVSTMARELAQHWGDPGWDLTVFGSGGEDEDESYDSARLRVATTPVSLPSFLYEDMVIAFPAAEATRELKKVRDGIIHLASPAMLGIHGMWYALAHDVPIVITHHTRWSSYAQVYAGDLLADPISQAADSMLGWLYRHSKATVVHSPGAGDEARALGARNVFYAPMGVPVPYKDLEQLNAERARARARVCAELNLSPDQPLLVSVGRLAIEKSIDVLLDAAAALQYPVVFVGDGPLREEVADSPYTIMAGLRHGQELADMYLAADLLVSASLTETAGRVFLESLAYGTPILLPDTGQQNSILSDDCLAILKFRRDEDYEGLDELVSAARAFMDRPADERDLLTGPALDFARQFAWEAVMPLHLAPYESIQERMKVSHN